MATTQFKARVWERAVVSGTGSVSLNGTAQAGPFRNFAAAITSGNQVVYSIQDSVANAWEMGVGTFTVGASPASTLTRAPLESSNGGSLVNFAGNTCDITVEIGSPSQTSAGAASAGVIPALNPNGQIDQTMITSALTVGEIKAFATPAAPSQWLLCYGQAVSRTTYSALFAAIGTTWGAGDGSTTFNLPDLRGRTLAGVDSMGGTAASRVTSAGSGVNGASLGAVGGSELMQSHTHVVNDPGHSHSTNLSSVLEYVSGGTYGTPSGTGVVSFNAPKIFSAGTGITNQSTGSGNSQNMPPVAMINIAIYAGV